MSSYLPPIDGSRVARRRRKNQLLRRYTSWVDLAASLPAALGTNERGIHDGPVTTSATEAGVISTAETQESSRMLINRPAGSSLPRAMSLPSHNRVTPSTLFPTTVPMLQPPLEPPVPPTWLSLGLGSATDRPDASASEPLAVCIPRFGFASLPGRSRAMEDALTVQPCLIPPRTANMVSGLAEGSDGSASQQTPQFSYFAVFDGHGGSHVSSLCKGQMHVFLAEELAQALDDKDVHHQPAAAVLPATSQAMPELRSHHSIPTVVWTQVLRSCFHRVDEMALVSCGCGRAASGSCACDQAGGLKSYMVGSTAVVAVVGRYELVVANCGDSRAVLGRAGKTVALSLDHKLDRPDELARIEEAGGVVIDMYGVPRVMGILAMSRAIGDKYLKPVVISEPEITVTDRTSEDEFLIIASDGLWDVLPNDLACNIVRHCLNDNYEPQTNPEHTGGEDEGREAGVLGSDAHCTLAAALLIRMALGRKSRDDISVIVVDLRIL